MFREQRTGRRMTGEKFVRDGTVGLRSDSDRIVFENRFAVARRFPDPDRARNDIPVHLLGEIFRNLLDDLTGKKRPTIVHRHHDPLEADVAVRFRSADLVDDVDDLRQSFETEPLALERDENLIRGGEGGSHQDTERRRRVENAVFEKIVRLERLKDVTEARQVVVAACEFDFDAGEVHFRGNQREVVAARLDDLIVNGSFADEDRIHAAAIRWFDAESAGAVRLGIEIDEKDALAAESESGGEIESGGGFTHTPFLVGDGDDFHVSARQAGRSRSLPFERGACNQIDPARRRFRYGVDRGSIPRHARRTWPIGMRQRCAPRHPGKRSRTGRP